MIPPKKLPYENTKADPERSKAEIITLLKKFGITDYQWSEQLGQPKLVFKTDVQTEEGRKWWTVLIEPHILVREALVYDESKGMRVKKPIALYAQSYRILLNHLKAKLTQVSLGTVKFEEEFMADIAVPTAEGPKRLAEFIKQKHPELLSLPEAVA